MITKTPLFKGNPPRTRGRNAGAPAIAWFSCGVTSAVATKLAIAKFETIRIIYIDTGGEHSDSIRFLHDCEKWIDHEVEIWKSDKFSDPFDVFESKRFLNSPYGAPCTYELKKKVRWRIEDEIKLWQAQIFWFRLLRDQAVYPIPRAKPQHESNCTPYRAKSIQKRLYVFIGEGWH